MVIDSFEILFEEHFDKDKSNLILGKGPSFSNYDNDQMYKNYNVIALNHAMRGIKALIGHAIDVEVFDQLNLDDLKHVEFLCIPWVPHVRKKLFYRRNIVFGPGRFTLPHYIKDNEILNYYHEKNKLYSYNLCSSPKRHMNTKLINIDAYYFSVEAAFQLIAKSGGKDIFTLGIDGGSKYSKKFKDIENVTKLQTGQSSYNQQFKKMAMTKYDFKLNTGPLGEQLPVKVYVGCMPEQELAFKVLDYSIQKSSSISVDVLQLHEAIQKKALTTREPIDKKNRGRTPFSFQRFLIPQLQEYSGKAIYLDSDMLVFSDIRNLWLAEMDNNDLLSASLEKKGKRIPQFSVMLLNCKKLKWNIDNLIDQLDGGIWTYEQLMYEMISVEEWAPNLPFEWNSLEYYKKNETHLLHFTDMDRQPWLNIFHKYSDLWVENLINAIEDGFISEDFVLEQIALGNVRPSLEYQIRKKVFCTNLVPFKVIVNDSKNFLPVHRLNSSFIIRAKFNITRVLNMVFNCIKINFRR